MSYIYIVTSLTTVMCIIASICVLSNLGVGNLNIQDASFLPFAANCYCIEPHDCYMSGNSGFVTRSGRLCEELLLRQILFPGNQIL